MTTTIATYPRPSYSELRTRISTDLVAMPAVLRDPLSAAWARACHGQHGYLAWIDAQCSPLTCELERLYDWAALYGVDRLSAQAASGQVLATGNAGTSLLAQTRLRGANGQDYLVDAAVVLGAGQTAVTVTAAEPGPAGNLTPGQTLTLIDPVPGCASTMLVDVAGLTGGAGAEVEGLWRARVAEEWRVVTTRGARSGKPEDYRFWAQGAHPSVTTALVQMHTLGVGTVIVRPICNDLVNRMPTAAVLDAVRARLASVAPATADWRVVAPLPRQVVVRIALYPGEDTATTRTRIQSELQAAVLAETEEGARLALAEIDAAIAKVTTQYTRLAPLADIAAATGEVLILAAVQWELQQ